MTTTLEATGVRFNDNTLQTTAASASPTYVGVKGQVFTGNGTFTIPTAVTAIKVTCIGGGGGSGAGGDGTYYGNSGGSGGNSTVASGSQSITTVTGTGGGGGVGGFNNVGTTKAPGTCPNGSGGDLNICGFNFALYGTNPLGTTMMSGTYGQGGYPGSTRQSTGGNGGAGGIAIKYLTGLTPGLTLAVTVGAGGARGSNGSGGQFGVVGQAGIVWIEW